MDNSVSFKVFLDKVDAEGYEVRRFGIPEDMTANFTFLKEKIRTMFQSLKNEEFIIHWIDSEDDTVAVGSDEELLVALSEMCSRKLIKLYITRQPSDSSPEKASKRQARNYFADPVLHVGVVCDNCEAPVSGFRYKCMQCTDYDLCSNCEMACAHPEHHMLRMPSPDFNNLSVLRGVCRASRKWTKVNHKMAGKHHNKGARQSDIDQKTAEWADNISGFVTNLIDLTSKTTENLSKVEIPGVINLSQGFTMPPKMSEASLPQPKETERAKKRERESKTTKAQRHCAESVHKQKSLNELTELKNVTFVAPTIETESTPEREQKSTPASESKPDYLNRSNQVNLSSTEGTAKVNENERKADTADQVFSFDQLQNILQKIVENESFPNYAQTPAGDNIITDLRKFVNDLLEPISSSNGAEAAASSVSTASADLTGNTSTSSQVGATGKTSTSSQVDLIGKTMEEQGVSCGSFDDGIRVSAAPDTKDLACPPSSRSSVCSSSSEEAEDGWTMLDQRNKASQSSGAIPKYSTPLTEPKEKTPAPTAPPTPKTISENIAESLTIMLSMGFTNEGGWLENMLINHNGNINSVLEQLIPSRHGKRDV